MSDLRKEYLAEKQHQDKIITESAIEWLKSNVILINEKIDRKTVNRLIDSIQKFDDTFGPYKDKLPALAQHLDMAERGLNLVITGKVSDRRTSHMLEQLSYLYSTFSNFFTRDLPVLVRTRLFTSAKDNPDMPINTIEGVDLETMQNAFSNALKPTQEERVLLSKIYRGTTLPKVNSREVSKQMTLLSYNDLLDLTKIGKVPMVVSDDGSADSNVTEHIVPKTDLFDSKTQKHITPDLAEQIIKKATSIMENDEKTLLEANLLLEINGAEIQSNIDSLKKIVNSVEILAPLKGPIDQLQTDFLQALNDGGVKSYLSQIAGSSSPGSIIKNLFSTPSGKIISQANMAVETMKNLSAAWGQIKNFTNKENVTEKDISNIKSILTKTVKGGILGKLTSMFKTQPYPGLSPDEVLEVLFAPLDDFLSGGGTQATAPKTESTTKDRDKLILEQASGLDALNNFKTAMQQLSTGIKGGGSASGSTTATASQKTQPSKPGEETTGAAGTKEPKNQPGGQDADTETSTALATAFKNKLKPEQLTQLTNILTKQGYKVVKK